MPRSTKILVVDDIEENIVALEALVQRPDVELLLAHSGPEALEFLLENDVALALLDVHMPGMDGFELAELMRGSPRTRHVPIIFLTAADHNTHRTFRGYEAGAVDFLYKPLHPHILRSKIDIFVQLYQQRIQLADQVERMAELLRTNELFIAVLGHDLRDPLSAIINMAQVLTNTAGTESSREWASRISKSGRRMARLIEQLLDLASMRASTFVLNCQPADLRDLWRTVIEEMEPLSKGRPIRLESAGNVQGHWDKDRLQQVFSNLLGNALHHGEHEGGIHIAIDGTDDTRLSVAINNKGKMDSTVGANAFEPFSKGEARNRSPAHFGLGLYIVKEVVRLHDGDLSIDSKSDGIVSVNVMLPRRNTSPQ